MGKQVHNSEEIEKLISNIFWFTYRQGFSPYEYNGQKTNTDSGWGCMIRVGQMMMAELLKKHLRNFYHFDIMKNQEYLLEFVQMFNDFESSQDQSNVQQNKHPFSIQQIMTIGNKLLSKKPEQWYSPNEIINILENIIKNGKIPMSLGLCFKPIYDNFVDLISITQEMCMNQCNCNNRKGADYKQLTKQLEHLRDEPVLINQNQRKHSFENNQKQIDEIKKALDALCNKCLIPRKAVAICLLSRIGCDSPNEQYIEMIRILMNKPYFCGMLGGRPKLANFLVGYVDDKFICMDPHLVQASQNDILNSCFTSNAMFFKMNEIDCSCGLVFYFKDFNDLAAFLADASINYLNSFFAIGTKKFTDINQQNIHEFETQTQQYQQELNKYTQENYIYESSSFSDNNIHQLDQSIQDYSIIDVPDHIHEHLPDHDSSFEQC